jgi:hypothetical protein
MANMPKWLGRHSVQKKLTCPECELIWGELFKIGGTSPPSPLRAPPLTGPRARAAGNSTDIQKLIGVLHGACDLIFSKNAKEKVLCEAVTKDLAELLPWLLKVPARRRAARSPPPRGQQSNTLAWDEPLGICSVIIPVCTVNCCAADTVPEQVHLALTGDSSEMAVRSSSARECVRSLTCSVQLGDAQAHGQLDRAVGPGLAGHDPLGRWRQPDANVHGRRLDRCGPHVHHGAARQTNATPRAPGVLRRRSLPACSLACCPARSTRTAWATARAAGAAHSTSAHCLPTPAPTSARCACCRWAIWRTTRPPTPPWRAWSPKLRAAWWTSCSTWATLGGQAVRCWIEGSGVLTRGPAGSYADGFMKHWDDFFRKIGACSGCAGPMRALMRESGGAARRARSKPRALHDRPRQPRVLVQFYRCAAGGRRAAGLRARDGRGRSSLGPLSGQRTKRASTCRTRRTRWPCSTR